jgi:hypothetical protein
MRSIGLRLQRLLPAAVVLVTMSCGAHVPGAAVTRPPGATAKVSGVVLTAPTCPADPVYHACRPRPLADVEVQARSASAAVMASARTGADGRYTLQVGPGSYLLVVVTTGVFPRCPHVRVSAVSGTAIRADITCDTGLRLPGPPAA